MGLVNAKTEPEDPAVLALARHLYNELLPSSWHTTDKRWQDVVQLGYAQRYIDRARRLIEVVDRARADQKMGVRK